MRAARILIIEDEVDLLCNNRAFLETQGYEVLTATRLSEARALLEQSRPDLILLDVMLPDGSGFDFCTYIRSITSAPVIFQTCRDDREDIIRGLSLGGDDYIAKPFDLDVLGARIASQLRRAGKFMSGRVELPPLAIDLMSGRATLAGTDIRLPQKELQLLAFLAANAGRRFSSEELYERAWGEPPLSATHTVTVHISNLRKKLRMDEENSPFEISYTNERTYVLNKVAY